MCSRLAPLAPRGRCLPAASARASRLAARPRVPNSEARVSPRRGVSRHAPEPPRASPADARGSLPGTAESTPESHDKRAGAPADVEARPSPATVAFEPLPDDTACVAWTDHMRWLFHRLDEAIGRCRRRRSTPTCVRARARPRGAGCPASRAGCTRALSRGACGSRTSTKARRSRSSTPSCTPRRARRSRIPPRRARRTSGIAPCWAWTCCASRRARTSWSVWICSPCPGTRRTSSGTPTI